MLKIIKNLLIISFLMLTSCTKEEILVEEELKVEFENIWWQMVNIPGWSSEEGSIYCYIFSTTEVVKYSGDGILFYYLEGSQLMHSLSPFERVDEGYYLTDHDIYLEIFVDDEGNYSLRGTQGIISSRADIIPCSLDL